MREIIGYLLIGSHNSVRKRVERELNEAMAAADQANLAKSEFLSSMSHELRTPLNAILGFAQLIETGAPPPTLSQQRSVGQILKAGWYLLELINEILDLSLIESGKLSLSLEPILLADVLRESRAMIEPQATKRDIQVTFPQLTTHFHTADRTSIKQVLLNLLSNAIKYNREGGAVSVDCRTRVRTNPDLGDRHRQGTDDGESREIVPAVQSPWSGGACRRRHRYRACGKQALVELMGGLIGVESTIGVGSVFWIELNVDDRAPASCHRGEYRIDVPVSTRRACRCARCFTSKTIQTI